MTGRPERHPPDLRPEPEAGADLIRPTSDAPFRLRFPATPAAAREAVSRVIAELERLGASCTWLGDVEIALAEALNNIAEHAYAQMPVGPVDVELSWEGGRLSIDIGDDGIAFPEGAPPEGEPVDVAVPKEELPEGGFGWLLLRSLTSGIAYDRVDGRNLLTLQFDVSPFDSDHGP